MGYDIIANQIEPIKIYEIQENGAFEYVDIISNYESLLFTRDWEGVGTWNLTINLNKPKAKELKQGRIIQIGTTNTRQGLIQLTEFKLTQDDSGNYVSELFVKGLELSSLMLSSITIPAGGFVDSEGLINYVGGDSHVTYTDLPEVIMYDLVEGSRISNTLFAFHNIDNLVNSALQGYGTVGPDTIIYSSRFKVLSSELKALSQSSGLGWGVEMNLDTNQFIFKVKEGIDRTESQSENDRVTFSFRRGNLRALTYTQDDITTRNHLLVAGQGEGASRSMIFVGEVTPYTIKNEVLFYDNADNYIGFDSEGLFQGDRYKFTFPADTNLGGQVHVSVDNGSTYYPCFAKDKVTPLIGHRVVSQVIQMQFLGGKFYVFTGTQEETGLKSKLKFVDARDITSDDGLFDRGYQKLAESSRRITLEVRGFSKKGTSKLDVDYTLGDLVTIEVPEWDLNVDLRVIRIIERITPANAGTIELLFGSSVDTVEGLIKQSFSDISNETNK